MTKMKTKAMWLAEYSESHQNPTNKKIHNICVPIIMYSIFGLFSLIPIPIALTSLLPIFNWSFALIIFSLIFYATLDIWTALKMLMISVVVYLPVHFLKMNWPQLELNYYIIVFVLAWIGQFIGHKIEGKKPSFFKDIQFLLIGPIWVFKV